VHVMLRDHDSEQWQWTARPPQCAICRAAVRRKPLQSRRRHGPREMLHAFVWPVSVMDESRGSGVVGCLRSFLSKWPKHSRGAPCRRRRLRPSLVPWMTASNYSCYSSLRADTSPTMLLIGHGSLSLSTYTMASHSDYLLTNESEIVQSNRAAVTCWKLNLFAFQLRARESPRQMLESLAH